MPKTKPSFPALIFKRQLKTPVNDLDPADLGATFKHVSDVT
jgi:hypothetical protein